MQATYPHTAAPKPRPHRGGRIEPISATRRSVPSPWQARHDRALRNGASIDALTCLLAFTVLGMLCEAMGWLY